MIMHHTRVTELLGHSSPEQLAEKYGLPDPSWHSDLRARVLALPGVGGSSDWVQRRDVLALLDGGES